MRRDLIIIREKIKRGLSLEEEEIKFLVLLINNYSKRENNHGMDLDP